MASIMGMKTISLDDINMVDLDNVQSNKRLNKESAEIIYSKVRAELTSYYKELEEFAPVELSNDSSSVTLSELDGKLVTCRQAINRITAMIMYALKLKNLATQALKLAKQDLEIALSGARVSDTVKSGKDVKERDAQCDIITIKESKLVSTLECFQDDIKCYLEVSTTIRDNYNEVRKDITTILQNAKVMAILGERRGSPISPSDLELTN